MYIDRITTFGWTSNHKILGLSEFVRFGLKRIFLSFANCRKVVKLSELCFLLGTPIDRL
jgi:hypothetical protein